MKKFLKNLLGRRGDAAEASINIPTPPPQHSKTHYFNNILNIISFYCKTDPVKADKAVLAFAAFFRSYMEGISYPAPAKLERELERVRSYIAVERLRTERYINIVFDVEADFFVMPFSILPYIEALIKCSNAAKNEEINIFLHAYTSNKKGIVEIRNSHDYDTVAFTKETAISGNQKITIDNALITLAFSKIKPAKARV